MGRMDVGADFWDEWAPFGMDVLRSAMRLLRAPGTVAREYVFGARKRHVNPFKLLLIGIAMLVLVLSQTTYFNASSAKASAAMAMVQSWANWSFSLGLVAILGTTQIWFRKRSSFNFIEHLVLACYCQFVIICISILSKLPVLVWREPGFLAAHQLASRWLLEFAGAVVLCVACTQFFQLRFRGNELRLLGASATFLVFKWLLVRAYAWLIVQIVPRQLT